MEDRVKFKFSNFQYLIKKFINKSENFYLPAESEEGGETS